MRVVSKQKEYIAIKVDFSKEFYINIGKYLREDQYVIKTIDDPRSYLPIDELFLMFKGQEIAVEKGTYILLDVEDKHIAYVSDEAINRDYLELKED